MRLSKKKANTSGQILVNILIAIAIFSILAHAIFTLVKVSYQFTNFSRARITARHLAQEKIELIRNLSFNEIGTSGGIPSGPLIQQENIQRNGLNYLVKTSIVYVDDPFDDSAPTDLLPTDYKSVRVDVSWEGLALSRNNPVVLVTTITPEGVETTEGGGTLSIFVFDADAQPVPQAEVKVIASSASPSVDLTLETADNGRVILPGAPACTDCYEITVTKLGYSSERTCSTAEIANPDKPHQTILEGDLTEISFAIDKVSTINIVSVNDRDSSFTPFTSAIFQMTGTKIIGTDTNGDPVYKFDQTLTTNVSGQLVLTDIEWGNYNISMLPASSWDISGTNPFLPLVVLPDTTCDFTFALSSHSNHSLLIGFTDTSQEPIASVSAILLDSPSYEETKFSGEFGNPDYGQAFFADLFVNTYDLEATASGFLDFSDTVPVEGRTQETIILTPE